MNNDILDKLDREGLKIAGIGKRVLAFLVDDFILSLIVFFVFYEQISNAKDRLEMINMLANYSFALVFLQFCYHTLFISFYGATLGKMLCKIAVVDQALFDRPNLAQSALRAVVRQISSSAFFLGFAWALGNDLKKTWQDYVAKTLVIELA